AVDGLMLACRRVAVGGLLTARKVSDTVEYTTFWAPTGAPQLPRARRQDPSGAHRAAGRPGRDRQEYDGDRIWRRCRRRRRRLDVPRRRDAGRGSGYPRYHLPRG